MKKKRLIIISVFLLSLLVLMIACSTGGGGGNKNRPTDTPDEKAWFTCAMFVDRNGGPSYIDAERFDVSYQGDSIYFTSVSYPDTNALWSCAVRLETNGDVELIR